MGIFARFCRCVVRYRSTGFHGEGIVPAPEANHAVKGAIDEALKCKQEGKSRTILFNLCGHGHFDMQAYTDYFADKLTDRSYTEEELAMALAGLPSIAA
jgi:tryptophan synthase beta chain